MLHPRIGYEPLHNDPIICDLIFVAVDKVETLKRYKFSLAFENSNEEDYVTEKFFQSLVAGMEICLLSLFILS